MASSDFEEIVKRPGDESSGKDHDRGGDGKNHDDGGGVADYDDNDVDGAGGAGDRDDVAAGQFWQSRHDESSRLHMSLSSLLPSS